MRARPTLQIGNLFKVHCELCVVYADPHWKTGLAVAHLPNNCQLLPEEGRKNYFLMNHFSVAKLGTSYSSLYLPHRSS
jgi:hypothetical protein